MRQKDKVKQIFNQLNEIGFHPIDVEYLNGYFIFDHGKDMVVHFHIKECKGWLFGIWWDLKDKNKFDFFTQYERDIDKFKPSASCFVQEGVSYNEGDLESELKWTVLPILKFIKKHPYVAWSYDGSYPRDCWDYKTGLEAMVAFYQSKIYHYYQSRLEKKFAKKYQKIAEKICDKKLKDYRIIDEGGEGVICYPRFQIVCKGILGEKLKNGNYSIDLESEVDKKLFKKAQQYDKQVGALQKKVYFSADIFNGQLSVWVKNG